MKRIILFLIVLTTFTFALAFNFSNYVISNADGYLLMKNNSNNFSEL
jgi:hypothetical protein